MLRFSFVITNIKNDFRSDFPKSFLDTILCFILCVILLMRLQDRIESIVTIKSLMPLFSIFVVRFMIPNAFRSNVRLAFLGIDFLIHIMGNTNLKDSSFANTLVFLFATSDFRISNCEKSALNSSTLSITTVLLILGLSIGSFRIVEIKDILFPILIILGWKRDKLPQCANEYTLWIVLFILLCIDYTSLHMNVFAMFILISVFLLHKFPKIIKNKADFDCNYLESANTILKTLGFVIACSSTIT